MPLRADFNLNTHAYDHSFFLERLDKDRHLVTYSPSARLPALPRSLAEAGAAGEELEAFAADVFEVRLASPMAQAAGRQSTAAEPRRRSGVERPASAPNRRAIRLAPVQAFG